VIPVPTADLVDALHNVALFAGKPSDYTDLDVVRVEWDGDHLHVQATNRYVMAWASPQIGPRDGVFDGPADAPWQAGVSTREVKHLAAALRTPDKATITGVGLCGSTVVFDRQPGPDLTPTTITVPAGDLSEFPPVGALLAAMTDTVPVERIAFGPALLGLFAKVRLPVREPVVFTMDGPTGATRWQMGDRLRGAIQPIRLDADPILADPLRT